MVLDLFHRLVQHEFLVVHFALTRELVVTEAAHVVAHVVGYAVAADPPPAVAAVALQGGAQAEDLDQWPCSAS